MKKIWAVIAIVFGVILMIMIDLLCRLSCGLGFTKSIDVTDDMWKQVIERLKEIKTDAFKKEPESEVVDQESAE